MYTINYKAHGWDKSKEIQVIDKEYMFIMFNQLLGAVDLHEVYILDGFTGEVLFEWRDGKFYIIDGIIVREG